MLKIIFFLLALTQVEPLGNLTFERQVMDEFPEWSELPNLFNELHVFSTGTIEDDGKNMLQVDFANRFIGGGVLGNVCCSFFPGFFFVFIWR
jgi:poly(ADP-ribose) glycohydrolase